MIESRSSLLQVLVADSPQPPLRRRVRRGYVPAEIITRTWDLTAAELRDMATGDPPLVRSIDGDGCMLYSWADAALVAMCTARPSRGEGEPSC